MKLLFDQNISYRIVNKLIDKFPNSKHVAEVGKNDKDDIDIWQFAKNEEFTIVSFDSDFYDISLIKSCPPKIIWIRTGNLTTNQVLNLLIAHEEAIHDFIEKEENAHKACLELL